MNMNWRTVTTRLALLVALSLTAAAEADREPVLKQIDVPHHYYYREMYLPQLTTGPSSLTWSPDGKALVYSMGGSLWRQQPGAATAVQLTSGPGYDYQPDWSPDGRRIVFVRYDNDAMELQLLDLETGQVSALTDGGAVNVEPRWSPDGSRLAFVSTEGTGRFHVFTGQLREDSLLASQLVDERESVVPRYYYSRFDHELSPAWSPDGKSLVYVANPETPYGTGDIWLRTLEDDTEPQLIRSEETSWRARPAMAPDGKRLVYSSYLGRQWHQLWLTRIDDIAEPFPLTYGDYDVTAARWSPDGKRIAYIANEFGNTEIRIQEVVGGKVTTVIATDRRYLRPMSNVTVKIDDAAGKPVAARVTVTGSDGRSYAPAGSLIHADDSFDRSVADFETHYFHVHGEATLTLPAGPARLTVWRGLENNIERRMINVGADTDSVITVTATALDLPAQWDDFVGGDVHVHMNYGGTYRNRPADLIAQAKAEDLDVVWNLIVNKEQRIPDIAYFSTEPDASSDSETLLLHSQEYHTSFWGHLGLLGLQSHLLIPDYAAYPGTGAASLFPDNGTIAELAHEQGAAVGYVHPFYAAPDPAQDESLTNALPVDAALGLVDFYEVVGFAYHRPSAEVWYRLMNCGISIAAAGGTDAMANYASLRGPVGANRTYVQVGDVSGAAARRDAWLGGLKDGRTVATNGPLVHLELAGQGPGGGVALEERTQSLRYRGFLRSIVPIDHLELVVNGAVVREFDLREDRRSADVSGEIAIPVSSWVLLRAWNDSAHPQVFDIYPYATTNAIRVTVAGEPQRSSSDADYFLAWIDRVREAAAGHPDYNTAEERNAVLERLDRARGFYEACRED
jgi:Tol biopolymer transport system component